MPPENSAWHGACDAVCVDQIIPLEKLDVVCFNETSAVFPSTLCCSLWLTHVRIVDKPSCRIPCKVYTTCWSNGPRHLCTQTSQNPWLRYTCTVIHRAYLVSKHSAFMQHLHFPHATAAPIRARRARYKCDTVLVSCGSLHTSNET